jgi:broad specificity phosphatase PhoE
VTIFLLIRHASHDLLGKALAGRAPGIHLNALGQREAEHLALSLASAGISALYTSPSERARDTAAPVAQRLSLASRVNADIDEIDFGDWTGRSFSDLDGDPGWSMWVEQRSRARPPNGEAFADVQRRATMAMDHLRREHADQTIALFTHGDVIKAVLAHYLCMSLDDLERFDIAPASVSVIVAVNGWAQVKLVNGRGEHAAVGCAAIDVHASS